MLACVMIGLTLAVAQSREQQAKPQDPSAAQLASAAERTRRVDDLFRQYHNPGSAGAAVLVIDKGKVTHSRGYGMANLEHGIPIAPETVFDIASVSKQFGAMAVALLEADGRMSLDDDVRKYLPELPDFGARITLRHLVHHTSGIRDWPGTLALGGWGFEDVMSFNQILRMAANQRELNFPPGSTHVYSNTGYNLLAEVVARVSGQSFRAFCDARIFAPLGMSSTHFHDNHSEVVMNRAESYRFGPGGRPEHVTSNLTALGSSSLFTTIVDLAKWIEHLHAPTAKVGGPKVVARLHEQGRLNSGETIAYAFGQSIGQYRGARMVSHTGSWAGYRSILQRFPEHQFAVVILGNHASMNPSTLARQIVEIHLGDRLAAAPTTPVQPPGGGAPAPSTAAPWNPTATELAAYTGEYRSLELQTTYIVEVRDGQLMARHFRTGDIRFRPVERDRFQAGTFGDVRFQRDAAGSVVAFTATTDRVRNVRFEKTKDEIGNTKEPE